MISNKSFKESSVSLFLVFMLMISFKVSASSVELHNSQNLISAELIFHSIGEEREEIKELFETQGPLRLEGGRLIEVGSLARIYFRENQMSHPSILSLMKVEGGLLSLVRFTNSNIPRWEDPNSAHLFYPLLGMLRGRSTDVCYTGTVTGIQWLMEAIIEKTNSSILASSVNRSDRNFRARVAFEGLTRDIVIPFCNP